VKQTDSINELAAALAAAQRMMEGAAKDSANPFFRSKYADLASVWLAIREPLAANGLSVVQMPSAEGAKITVTTILMHSSGQWISSELTMTAQRQLKDGGGWEELNTPQAIGSTITYARRYALASICGVAPEDDDAEAAQGRAPQRAAAPPATKEPTLRERINTATGNIHAKFKALNQEPEFFRILGSEGCTSIAEIPENEKAAQRIIAALKIGLGDIKRYE
jgi:hypothetical protein